MIKKKEMRGRRGGGGGGGEGDKTLKKEINVKKIN